MWEQVERGLRIRVVSGADGAGREAVAMWMRSVQRVAAMRSLLRAHTPRFSGLRAAAWTFDLTLLRTDLPRAASSVPSRPSGVGDFVRSRPLLARTNMVRSVSE